MTDENPFPEELKPISHSIRLKKLLRTSTVPRALTRYLRTNLYFFWERK